MSKSSPRNYRIKVLEWGQLVGPEGSISMRIQSMRTMERARFELYSYLIEGPYIPLMLVDTGIKEDKPDLMAAAGVEWKHGPDNTVERQLAKWGYRREDVKVILHTHLHSDHAGNDYQFPGAKIIMSRQELMWAAGGVQGGQYPKETLLYLVEQSYVPGRMRLLDGDAEIAPGILCEMCPGHTPGGMNIRVNTGAGLAIICGDIIYDQHLQTQELSFAPQVKAQTEWGGGIEAFGDWPTGNHVDLVQARWWVQKLMREADILLPSHDPTVVRTHGHEIG